VELLLHVDDARVELLEVLLQRLLLRILDPRIGEPFGDVVPAVEEPAHVLAEHLALGLHRLVDLARGAGLRDPDGHLWRCELRGRRWRRRRLNRRSLLHRCSWISRGPLHEDHPSLRLVV
jgi:hypothetical protein